MSDPQQNIDRLQLLIDNPDTSDAFKISYLAQQTEWVKRLPIAGKFY